jgi:hypothetical protein
MAETHKISTIHTHTHTHTSMIVMSLNCHNVKKVSSERYKYDDMNTGAYNYTFLSCAEETTVGDNDV